MPVKGRRWGGKGRRNKYAKNQKAKAKFTKRYEQSSSSELEVRNSEKAVQDWADKG